MSEALDFMDKVIQEETAICQAMGYKDFDEAINKLNEEKGNGKGLISNNL